MTDTLDWYRREVARYRYKSGWTFEVIHPLGWPQLLIKFKTPDSREGGREDVTVGTAALIPTMFAETDDKEGFASWLRQAVTRAEQHEIDEWLRRDEVVIFDPHRSAVDGPRRQSMERLRKTTL